MTLAVVFASAAAFSNALNLMTQHSASVGAPKRKKGWRLAVYLVRHPLWLLGAAAAVGSYLFQALALHNGPMSVVQPPLVAELVFVLVLRRVWIHQDVAHAAWAAVLVVCVALAVFLAAEPRGGKPTPDTAEWLSAGLVFGGLSPRWRRRGCGAHRGGGEPPSSRVAAALHLGAGGNVPPAATDTLATFGIGGLLIRWPAYAFIAATATGTVLQQAALHVGPLSVSQPFLVIIDPLASIILSVWLFDERFTNSPAKIAVAVMAFAVMAAGVTVLTRTAPQDLTPSRPAGKSPLAG